MFELWSFAHASQHKPKRTHFKATFVIIILLIHNLQKLAASSPTYWSLLVVFYTMWWWEAEKWLDKLLNPPLPNRFNLKFCVSWEYSCIPSPLPSSRGGEGQWFGNPGCRSYQHVSSRVFGRCKTQHNSHHDTQLLPTALHQTLKQRSDALSNCNLITFSDFLYFISNALLNLFLKNVSLGNFCIEGTTNNV